MKQTALLVSLLAVLVFASCERCTSDEPTIFLNLKDSTGADVMTVNALYALNQINDEYNGDFALALDLSRDSTVYIIERDQRIDTLKFKYQRILSTGTGGSGYCMKIKHQEPQSSLNIECYTFEPSFSLNPNRCPLYEITLSY